MRLTLVRHATLLVEMAGVRILVDPMLDPAGARGPVPGTPMPRPNPLVPLPRPATEVVRGLDAIVVTHLHQDHIDGTALRVIEPGTRVLCQPEDMAELARAGLTTLTPLGPGVAVGPVAVTRTRGSHGRGQVGAALGPVSGVVLRAPGEPVVMVAGDTVLYDELALVLVREAPDVVVVNAGAAQFTEGGPITMDADDAVGTARVLPGVVVAVHMEAVNHCLLTRAELRERLTEEGLSDRVLVPDDGQSLELTVRAPGGG